MAFAEALQCNGSEHDINGILPRRLGRPFRDFESA
jgi:hypothetical protein